MQYLRFILMVLFVGLKWLLSCFKIYLYLHIKEKTNNKVEVRPVRVSIHIYTFPLKSVWQTLEVFIVWFAKESAKVLSAACLSRFKALLFSVTLVLIDLVTWTKNNRFAFIMWWAGINRIQRAVYILEQIKMHRICIRKRCTSPKIHFFYQQYWI